MDFKQLETRWATITKPVSQGYSYLRISPECVPDLSLGLSHAGNRCLVLELPHNWPKKISEVRKAYLSLAYRPETSVLLIELSESNFNDLFNDLIHSIYVKINFIRDIEECYSIFVESFHKWCEFFTDEASNSLTRKDIQGLFGELVVLEYLIGEQNYPHINNILNSWKGPFDEGHDFILAAENIEVKSHDTSTSQITISSEYQLDEIPGKKLLLAVVEIDADPLLGMTVSEKVNGLRKPIHRLAGDFTIILRALSQKGISPRTIKEYDHLIFNASKISIYAVEALFPRLIRSQIPKAIGGVTYRITTNLLTPFLTKTILPPNGD